jgi:hypothetical protein
VVATPAPSPAPSTPAVAIAPVVPRPLPGGTQRKPPPQQPAADEDLALEELELDLD